MANLSKVIYINEVDYSTLLNGGTITKGGVTYSYDSTALYVIKNVSAPEYAETAGYATTAGQATKATQDGNGDVISETYAKKSDAAEAIHLTGTLSGGYWTFEDINGNTLTDAEMIALLEDPNKLISIYYNGFSDGTRTYEATVFRPIGSDSTTFTNFDGNWKRYFYISLDWINDRVCDDEHGVDDSLESRQKEIITLGGTNNAPTFTDWEGFPLTHFEFKTQYLDGFKKDVILKVQISTDVYHYYQLFKSEKQASTLTNYRFISFPNTTTVECVELLDNSSNNTFQRGGSNASLQTLINSGNKLSADYIQDGTNNKVFSAADKTKLDGIEAATASPLMDSNADVGSSTKYAKEDHVHPSDTSRVPTSRKINNNPLSSDITLTASDVGALPSSTVIPDELADLSDDSTHRLVTDAEKSTWSSKQDALVSGTNIKTVDGESLLGLGNIDTTFIVEITYDTNTNTYRASETFANIYTAWNNGNGKDIICTVEGYTFQLYYVDSNDIYFSSLISDVNAYCTIHIDTNNVVSRFFGNIPGLANNLTTTDSGQALDATQGRILKNMITAQQVRVGSVAGKLYRNNVGGSGNFSISGNSGCIPNLVAGTYQVAIYAKSSTQAYIFRFNFGSSVTYDLTATKGIINDFREITIPSNGTFSGSVLNSSVASGTILYVVMYDYVTPVSTVGIAAVTNRYSDLDGTPTIPTVPTNISSFTNNVGYVTSTAITDLTDIL